MQELYACPAAANGEYIRTRVHSAPLPLRKGATMDILAAARRWSLQTTGSVFAADRPGIAMSQQQATHFEVCFASDMVASNVAMLKRWSGDILDLRSHRQQALVEEVATCTMFHSPCMKHQLNIGRKPLALSVEGLWTNYVRFSHLLKVRSFIDNLDNAIDVIFQPPMFTWVPVASMDDAPAGTRQNVRKAHALIASASEDLSADDTSLFLDFMTSNIDEDMVIHICVAGHCSNAEESLRKFKSVVRQSVLGGYDTPLLYRMKHYGPAASYVRRNTVVHRILPRLLNAVSKKKRRQALGPAEQAIDLDNPNSSISTANGVRFVKLHAYAMQPMFRDDVEYVHAILSPYDQVESIFAERTLLQHSLLDGIVLKDFTNLAEMEERVVSIFVRVATGQTGADLMSHFLGLVHTRPIREVALHFSTFMRALGEAYWRFVSRFSAWPWLWFLYLRLDPQSLPRLQSLVDEACEHCFDMEFSSDVLKLFLDVSMRKVLKDKLLRHAKWARFSMAVAIDDRRAWRVGAYCLLLVLLYRMFCISVRVSNVWTTHINIIIGLSLVMRIIYYIYICCMYL
jgi:hypothetical protein